MRAHPSLLFVLLLLATAGPARGADPNNDGLPGAPTQPASPSYGGPLTISATTAVFPVNTDNFAVVYFPYWWNLGDTGWGNRAIAETEVTAASISLVLSYTVLSCDKLDFVFLINGVLVGSFQIAPVDGLGPIVRNFGPFPGIPSNAGTYELRYRVNRTVTLGCGSVSLDLDGRSTVTLMGTPTPTWAGSWGRIKTLYR